MNSIFAHGWWLLAQAGEAAAENGAGGGGAPAEDQESPLWMFLANPLNIILISAILFMFIVVRPQQKQARELQKRLAGLKKNDRVITASGIHGTVVQAAEGESTVTLRIDENTGARLTVNRDSISSIVSQDNKE